VSGRGQQGRWLARSLPPTSVSSTRSAKKGFLERIRQGKLGSYYSKETTMAIAITTKRTGPTGRSMMPKITAKAGDLKSLTMNLPGGTGSLSTVRARGETRMSGRDEDDHAAVAVALAKQLGWTGQLLRAGLPHGEYVFVVVENLDKCDAIPIV